MLKSTTAKLIFKYCSIVIIVGYSRCTSPTSHPLLNFPTYGSVQGEPILEEAIDIHSLVVGGEYLIAKLRNNEYHLRIYDKKSLEPLQSMVRKGSGVDELPTVVSINSFEQAKEHSFLWLHDINQMNLVRLNLTSSLKAQKTVFSQSIALSSELYFSKAFIVDSARVIGNSMNVDIKMKRLKVYDIQKKQLLKTIDLFPELNTSKKDIEFLIDKFHPLYVNTLDFNKTKQIFVSAMYRMNRLDFFDSSGDLIYSAFDGAEMETDVIRNYLNDEADFTELNYYYHSVSATQNYLYTFYTGRAYDSEPTATHPNVIRVFDWSGRPIAQLIIKESLSSMSMDSQTGWLYGVDYLHEKIVRYDLTPYLNEF